MKDHEEEFFFMFFLGNTPGYGQPGATWRAVYSFGPAT
jgi:hypothetical protein